MQNILQQIQNTAVPPSAGGGFKFAGATLSDIISALLPYIFYGAGLLLLLYLIFGGYQLMLSAGDPKKVQGGKAKITSALIGFFIIFISYWLIKIVARIFGIQAIIDIFG